MIFNKNLRADHGNPLFSLEHAPLVADFDQNGTMDVFIVGGYGVIPFADNFGRAYMLSVGKGNGPDWLMFQNDIRRQSNVCGTGTSNVIEIESTPSTFSIFPNPSSGDMHLNFEVGKYLDYSIQLFDIVGNIVGLPSASIISPSQIAYKLNVADGIYSFKITHKKTGQSSAKKIVIKR